MKPTTIRLALALAGILAAGGRAEASAPARQQAFDFGRRFALGAQVPAYDGSRWEAVDLPHDWSIHLDFDRDAPAGRAGAFLPASATPGWTTPRSA